MPPKGNVTQSLHAVRPFTNRQDFTTQRSCFKIKTQTFRAKLGNATNGNTKRTQQGKPLLQHICPFCYDRIKGVFEANPLPPKGNATQSSHAVRPFTNRQDFTTQQSCFKIKTQTCRAKLGNATNGNTKRTQQGKSLSQHTPFATTELRQTFPQPRIRVTTTRRTSTVAKTVPAAQNRGRLCVTSQRNKKNVPKIRTPLLQKDFVCTVL